MNIFINWYKRRQTMRALQALPDHILEDIGINRYEIEACAKAHSAKGPRIKRRMAGIRPVLAKPLHLGEAV